MQTGLWWSLLVGALVVSCQGDSASMSGTDEGTIAKTGQALTSDQQRVLSFEAAPGVDWVQQGGSGAISQSSINSDAMYSLLLQPASDNELHLATTLASLGDVGDMVSLDVRFNQAQPG